MTDRFEMLRQILSYGSASDTSIFNMHFSGDNNIIIGGSCQQTFNLPFNNKIIKKLWISYVQDDKVVIRKELDNCDIACFDDTLLFFNLKESETSLFRRGDVTAQLKVQLKSGDIIISDTLHIKAIATIDDQMFVENDSSILAIRANVVGRNISLESYCDIVAEISDNKLNQAYICKFIFDGTWDAYVSKTVLFKDEYNHLISVDLEADDTCRIPFEVIQRPGRIYVGVTGGEERFKKTSEWSESLRVNAGPLYDMATKKYDENDVLVKRWIENGLISVDLAFTDDTPVATISFEGVE